MLLYNHEMLAKEVAKYRREGETVLFTNGCFDPLRAKHVRFFELIREQPRVFYAKVKLLVAVNGDASVTRLKGPGRPIFALAERMDMINGLRSVDWVTRFDEDTPLELIRTVRPKIIVKGGDYTPAQIAGHSLVDEVLIIPTAEAWPASHCPPSINELIANSASAMILSAINYRDQEKLYGEKKE